MHPPPPPRRKPGEKDENEQPRKGRCLLRENQEFTPKKKSESDESEKKPVGGSSKRAAKSSDYHLLNGIRVGKGFFWATASALAIIVLAALSIPMLWLMQPKSGANIAQEENSTAPTEPQAPEESAIATAPLRDGYQQLKSNALKQIDENPSNLEEVLEAYGLATGFNQARTVSMEGSASSNNREYDMNVFAKAPNQLRQVMAHGDTKITCVYNGNEGNLELVNYANNRQSSRMLTAEQSLSALMSSVVSLPIWQYERAPSSLEDLGLDTIDGVVYRVIANHQFETATIMHYLDADTMIERMRLAEYESDGEPCRIQVKYSDYQKNGDFYAPMRIEVVEQQNIEIRTICVIEKWSFNKGLLPSLFVVNND